MLKIAHVCRPLIQPAGTERSVVEMASEMAKQGLEVRIYTPKLREDLFGGMSKTVDVEEVGVPSSPLFDFYFDLILAKRLVSEACKWADILILHHGHPVASLAITRFSKTCIPFYHIDRWDRNMWGGLRPIERIYTFPLNALELKSLREVPLVFANSESLANTIRSQEPRAKVVPITIGVDTSKFSPKWEKDDGFIMMAGRFHPMNNFDLGIAAVCRTDFKLTISGIVENKTLWYYTHLKRILSRNPDLSERVVIETNGEDGLIDRLQRCSLFFSPRIYDYLGHAALEPMACAKPVVQLMTQPRFEDDPPIILCRNDPNEWRNSARALLDDPKSRKELGRKSYEFVQEKHSLKLTVSQILHFAVNLFRNQGK
ncbi:glycosyltransferase family 4 protein [Candidatus Bathyarchaeota archaeon]|nr:MAG: glycosyltransferase family 4 protein [Candidatus Bathyarchaeota archaeon]